MNTRTTKDKENDGGDKLVQRSVMVERDLWNRARSKVGVFGSLSDVVRKLIRLWVEGKINLDDYED